MQRAGGAQPGPASCSFQAIPGRCLLCCEALLACAAIAGPKLTLSRLPGKHRIAELADMSPVAAWPQSKSKGLLTACLGMGSGGHGPVTLDGVPEVQGVQAPRHLPVKVKAGLCGGSPAAQSQQVRAASPAPLSESNVCLQHLYLQSARGGHAGRQPDVSEHKRQVSRLCICCLAGWHVPLHCSAAGPCSCSKLSQSRARRCCRSPTGLCTAQGACVLCIWNTGSPGGP